MRGVYNTKGKRGWVNLSGRIYPTFTLQQSTRHNSQKTCPSYREKASPSLQEDRVRQYPHKQHVDAVQVLPWNAARMLVGILAAVTAGYLG